MTDKGIVIRGHGKIYIVRTQDREIPCKIRGKLKFQSETVPAVAVGDDVVISLNRDGSGVIEEVEERRSMFFRPAKTSDDVKQVIAANIDQLGIISSVKKPKLKPGLIDRFIITARIGGLEPIIIVNKIDLGWPDIIDELREGYGEIGIPFLTVSAETGDGFEGLENILADKKTILAGHSGVGKSSILNRLIPGLDLRVGEISRYSQKGVHTTSWVELIELPGGGYVIDSPGLKILKLWMIEKGELERYYPEMDAFRDQCRFSACSHTHEPDCAVKAAVEEGKLPEFRYKNYVSLYESLDSEE
jgi:ribosome biogenesis GTPase